MTNGEFQRFLHHNIPATALLAFRVLEFANGPVKISVPLRENLNIGNTAFGGSVSTLLITVCWAEVYKLMQNIDPDCQLVIQQSLVDYKFPIITDFEAIATSPDVPTVEAMLQTYHRFGKARIHMQSSIRIKNQIAAHFQGKFAILK
jgi:thioesterase domain-containing protein